MKFHENLYQIRKKAKLSQDEFAELFHVSRQAVQKWESGTSLPELSKVLEISKHFGISLDALLLSRNPRMAEELNTATIKPDYAKIPDWEFYASTLMTEYRQCCDEGLDLDPYRELFETVAKLPQDEIKKDLGDILYRIVRSAPRRSDYAFCEPSSLEEIKALRVNPGTVRPVPDQSVLTSKTEGAWFGRICGCMLGKAVECIMSDELHRFLKATDNFPMHRYILRTDLDKVNLADYNYDFKNRVYIDDAHCMPVDDDTNYTVLAQEIISRWGKDFTPEDVMTAWVEYQPKGSYCTAERVAFCNFIKGYRPPESAIYQNPYREWIGAQIRADYWGYINPGDPETAADMAWRDASVSHVKNGIYGEMFVAAMLAEAALTADLEAIIRGGLAQIPHTSRLYEDVNNVLSAYREKTPQKDVFDMIHRQFNEHDSHGWCHTNSNAMIVAASLLYGEGDFEKSICMAVETGFDTDCNGATVGSVFGMAKGIESIPKHWYEPLCDTLDTSIFGVGTVKISDRIRLTLEHIQNKN